MKDRHMGLLNKFEKTLLGGIFSKFLSLIPQPEFECVESLWEEKTRYRRKRNYLVQKTIHLVMVSEW